MIKRFFNENKILLTNLVLISFIVISFFIKNPDYIELRKYLKSMGCLGLTCSIINWFALEIMLDKISFLYTIDKVRDYLTPFKNFLINDIFANKNFDDLKNDCKNVLTDEDKEKIENNIYDLTINNIVRAFNDKEKLKCLIKENILDKIFEIETVVKAKLQNGLSEEDKNKSGEEIFKEDILPIIENKLEMSILVKAQSALYQTVKDYFEWLVLWGAYCGAIFGLVFRFIGCL